jgi:hypothetical protein
MRSSAEAGAAASKAAQSAVLKNASRTDTLPAAGRQRRGGISVGRINVQRAVRFRA